VALEVVERVVEVVLEDEVEVVEGEVVMKEVGEFRECLHYPSLSRCMPKWTYPQVLNKYINSETI
jgi:hypothetical protein